MISNGGSTTSLSCLGAVAGSQGVALFRLSKPHVPLLILSHATNSASTNSILSMAFEPKQSATDTLYLAATRGSGVLIWDASGHSPNPLVARVSMDQPIQTGLDDPRLTSLAWKPSPTSSSLVTVSPSSLCVWDLRIPSKPSTRFGPTRKASASPFVQVACSSNDEVAVIDMAGVVQVYDIRMNTARNQSFVSSFAAHETAGVGIASFGTSRWLSWGLDAPMTSAVIKIWTKRDAIVMSREEMPPKTAVSPRDYSLAAQCIRPNLACARVCPSPTENKFMAIGHLPRHEPDCRPEKLEGWWAELYKLQDEAEDTFAANHRFSIRTFGVEKEAAFYGGEATCNDDKTILVSALGSRTRLGALQAAEISLASTGKTSDESDVDVILCCLSDSGVVSTHVRVLFQLSPCDTNDTSPPRNTFLLQSIPEVMSKSLTPEGASPKSPKKTINIRGNLVARTAFSLGNQPRIYPEDREGASLMDAASFWGTSRPSTEPAGLNSFDERKLNLDPSSSSPQKKVQDCDQSSNFIRRSEGGLMPFDMDVPVSYGSVTTGTVTSLQIGMTDMSTGAFVTSAGKGGIVEEGLPVSIDPSKKGTNVDTFETERVPCPRLCGAVFGRANGGLVTFHNGEVKKMWSWYQRTDNFKIPQLPTRVEQEGMRQVHNATASGSTQPLTTIDGVSTKATVISKQGPRTLKELVSMVSAAKDAQWGDEVASDGSDSNGVLSGGGNFFEDDSLGSNSSDEDEDDEGLGNSQTEDVYKRYFGGQDHVKGEVPKALQSPSLSPNLRTKKPQPFAGPSSDILCPVVRLIRNYDKDMLGNQSVTLAEGWELGPWDTSLNMPDLEVPFPLHPEESKSDFALGDVDPIPQEGPFGVSNSLLSCIHPY